MIVANVLIGLAVIVGGAFVVALICALIWDLFVFPKKEKMRKTTRATVARYVIDDEDVALSPAELVMKYNLPLTTVEFDRLCFDREYANRVMDAHFVQQQRDDMDSAMHMHQIAHQTAQQMAAGAHGIAYQQAMDFYSQAHDMAQQNNAMHNDMFNACSSGGMFF